MKKISQVILSLIVILSLSGCFDRRDIDDMAYVIALGIDKGQQKELKVTFQIAVPKNIASGGGSGGSSGGGGKGGGGQDKFILVSVETPTVYSAINGLNALLSRQINMSHCQLLLFSEKVAQDGILKYLQNFQRIREFRPNMHIAISKGDAKDYLQTVESKLESNTAEYYQESFRTYRYTGYATSSRFNEVYYNMRDIASQAVANLVIIGNEIGKTDISNKSDNSQPGMTPDLIRETGNESETLGLAVFKNDKMVGELNWEESTCYLLLSGSYQYSYWTFPDPKSPDSSIVIRVRQNRKPIKSVNINSNNIMISLEIFLEGDITVIRSRIPYEDEKELNMLDDSIISYIKSRLTKYLEKTSKTFESDINNFGNIAKSKFSTLQEWKDYNWPNKYKNAKFEVKVDFKIRRPGLVLNSSSNKAFEKEQ